MKELKYVDKVEEEFIEKLPFIDDNSDNYDKNPEAIKWLKNGELGSGLNLSNKRDFQSLGSLNRVPYQLYQDLVIVHENTKQLKDEILKLNDKVGDFDELEIRQLIEDLRNYDTRLINIEQDIRNFQFDIQSFEYKQDTFEKLLGLRNDLIIDDVTTTIYILKLLVGNDTDTDLNGNQSSGSEATGLFYRLLSVSGEVNKLSKDLTELKQSIGGNDVVELVETINKINTSIGVYTNSVNISTRLDKIDTSIETIETSIEGINGKLIIKSDDTNYTISDFKTEYDQYVLKNDKFVNDSIEYQNKNTSDIEGINNNIGTNKSSIDAIKNDIGKNDSEGLKKRIKTVEDKNTQIENNNTTITETMNGILFDMQNINNKLGDENSGVIGSVSAMSVILLGEDGNGGIKNDVDEMKLQVFADAPKDGNSYLRKDGKWIQKAFALCKYSDSDYNKIDVSGEIKIPLSTLTPAIKNGINVDSNNDITITDNGYFNITFDCVVADITKQYKIDLYNGVNKINSSSIAVSTIDGKQLIAIETIFSCKSGDKLHFNITPINEESNGNNDFKFTFSIRPAN